MGKREVLTFVVSASLTLILALGIIRYFAPQWLGIPVDLQMVRVAEEVPPFFDGVFREEDFESGSFIIQDPYIQRARPLFLDGGSWGPHDLLGFRNRAIPAVADVVTIGDSMTYGMGVVLEKSWPRRLEALLEEKSAAVYNMAIGGWCAVEYLRILPRALRFRPRVIVVAFYTGNDPRETLSRVYYRPELEYLRLDPSVHPSQLPPLAYPPPKAQWWEAEFSDGYKTIFTPKLWYGSNQDHPALDVAYAIMADVAVRIEEMASRAGARTVFLVLPTKSLALVPKVEGDDLDAPEDYRNLIRDESQHLERFVDELRKIEGATFVDVIPALQQAALDSVALFPGDIDGHPGAAGHEIIAKLVAPSVDVLLPHPLDGAVRVVYEEQEVKEVYSKRILIRQDASHLYRFLLIRNGYLWRFRSLEIFEANGWKMEELPDVRPRDIAALPHAGVIEGVDRARFGPRD